MRILIAITKGEVGGAQSHVAVLSGGLLAAGHQLAVLVEGESALARHVSAKGGEVLPWHSITGRPSPLADLRARQELRGAVRSWCPDVLHLHSSKAGVIGTGILAPPRGVTVFTCHHAPFGPGRKLKHRLVARPIEQVALPRLHGIITVGVRDQPALQRLAPNVAIRHIPNAVPAPLAPASTGALRPVALWVARLQHPKDPLLAVDAWEVVARAIPDARLLLAGTGPLERKLARKIQQSAAGRHIAQLGYVDDLAPLQAASSLFVLPTRVEGGLTMATLEAMANGLVPVVSDAGDARRLDELQCGVCVRSRGPRAFAQAVVSVLNDAGRYERLRANAISYACEKRTPADVVRDTEAFYREILAARC